jgi:hypothetical protein
MAEIEIITVESGSELSDFIGLPWKIYGDYPYWVPPLKKEVRRMLDPLRHPFWESSERVLFLARRGPDTVGRIAGIIDGRYNQFHNEKMGIWGFFECTDDPEAAAALFSSAASWLQSKGMTFIRGPLNPSTNHEVGMLIQGFDSPPSLMMTYNPPYYPALVETCGFTKEKDLLSFLIKKEYHLPEWMDRLAERIAQKKGVRIEPFKPKNAAAEMTMIREIYNDAWSDNWGFVPLSDNEIQDIGKELMEFTDTDLAFFIWVENEPAAFCMIVPDINPLIKRFNGRIGLLGMLKYFLYRHEVTGLRMFMFGIKEKYRQIGLPMLVFQHILALVRGKKQYQQMEMGWTLEDNEAVNSLIEEAGAEPYKRYRIYRKSL